MTINPKNKDTYLFSYGTLQALPVQIATFGRPLNGETDRLLGYTLSMVDIHHTGVIHTSGQAKHPIATPSHNKDDYIDGTVFNMNITEIALADTYEVDAYRRISVTLESGITAWVYVDAQTVKDIS